jgi:hypothetical protein
LKVQNFAKPTAREQQEPEGGSGGRMELRAPSIWGRKVLRGRLGLINPPREADSFAFPQRRAKPLQLIGGQEPLAPFLWKFLDALCRIEAIGNAGNVRGREA